jgi:hypothetical protein
VPNGDGTPVDSAAEPVQSAASASARNRQKFTADKDRCLLRLVAMGGTHDRKTVSLYMNGRSLRQCRVRFKYHLKPGPRRSAWTRWEDRLLFEKRREYGPRWVQIAAVFQGRTDIDAKNRDRVTQRAMTDAGVEEQPAGAAHATSRRQEQMIAAVVAAPDLEPPPAAARTALFALPVSLRRIRVASLRAGEFSVSAQEPGSAWVNEGLRRNDCASVKKRVGVLNSGRI